MFPIASGVGIRIDNTNLVAFLVKLNLSSDIFWKGWSWSLHSTTWWDAFSSTQPPYQSPLSISRASSGNSCKEWTRLHGPRLGNCDAAQDTTAQLDSNSDVMNRSAFHVLLVASGVSFPSICCALPQCATVPFYLSWSFPSQS